MASLDNLASGSRVAVIRLRSLGDCVLTTPALHILKSARPDLRVGVVVESRFAPIFEGNPDVDEILTPGLPSLRSFGPELCLNLHGGVRSMALTALSGAHIRAGFGHHKGARIYNAAIPRAQEVLRVERKVHTAEHLASAIFHLGIPRCEIPRSRLFAERQRRPRPYAVIHPVAATREKTWPPESFIRIAKLIERNHGLETVFIGAKHDDLTIFEAFQTVSGAPLREVKSLIAQAAAFVGNDSGPAHIAAAFGIPSVVLFGPSDSIVWGPWRTEAEVIVRNPIELIRVEDVARAMELLRVTR